jgi:hypothetical protein
MVATNPGKNFFNPQTFMAIKDLNILAKLVVDGFLQGTHKGPKQAFSHEYSKHREYYPGDPLKSVDWKLYGKTDKYFVKQYEEETNLVSWLVMDTSKSMLYQGSKTKISKLQYATYLAAAISYLLFLQKDAVGMIQFDDQVRKVIPTRSSRNHLNVLLRELSQIKEGATTNFESAAKQVAARIKKRGLVILFTDLLIRPEKIESTLKHFLHPGSELIIFHILSFEELEFPFKKFSHFEDMETLSRVLLNPEYIKDEYVNQMKVYLETVKSECQKLKVSYQLLKTTTPFDQALMAFLQARSKMI